MKTLTTLKVKLFADGADKNTMLDMYRNPLIKGMTTNPSLMKKAGITDYEAFAKDVLSVVKDKPISFEVFADDFNEMEAQAKRIASWGQNVYVKIPVTNTKGQFAGNLIKKLSDAGVSVNVTALVSVAQVQAVANCLSPNTPAVLSVFAGRIADTGVDPMPLMRECVNVLKPWPKAELLWASTRELFNIMQADEVGCHIITVPNAILSQLKLVGKNLEEYSLETVKMFYTDAMAAGFTLRMDEEVVA